MPVKKVTSNKKQVTSKEDPASSLRAKRSNLSTLSVPVYSLAGKATGKMELPKELFAGKVNQALLAQAARVYLNNQSGHYSHTKTRSEVQGSSRKIKPQKEMGTRHGSIRAPIFVGGGIALGPKSRKIMLELPKKMKRAALVSALSDKLVSGEVMGADLNKASGKTSQMVKFLQAIRKQSVLVVMQTKSDSVRRATNNIPGISMTTADQLNALEVMKYQTLVLSKDFRKTQKGDK